MTGLETDRGGVELPPGPRSIYDQGEVAKFLATLSSDGVPNVALIVSQVPVESDRIAFGDFMMVKTRKNLDENPRVASLAMTQKLEMAGLKAEVEGWVQSGPYVDRINSVDFFRYNAYAGIHNVAVARVTEISRIPPRVSYLAVLSDFLGVRSLGRLGGDDGTGGAFIPVVVRKKLNGILSIKVVAFEDTGGYPGICPVFGITINRKGLLRFKVSGYNEALGRIEPPAPVALAVLTMDLLQYQVKGELLGFARAGGTKTGLVRIDEAYSSMPPFCGQRIS